MTQPSKTQFGYRRHPDQDRVSANAADHPVIVHLYDTAQLAGWARAIPEGARKLAATFWPGPLTLILPRAAHVTDAVTGGQDSIGLRIPSHPVARAQRATPQRASHIRSM